MQIELLVSTIVNKLYMCILIGFFNPYSSYFYLPFIYFYLYTLNVKRCSKDGARPWTNFICRLYFLCQKQSSTRKGLPQLDRYKDRIKDAGQASFIPKDDRSGTAGDKACRLGRREARPPPPRRAGSSPIHLP